MRKRVFSSVVLVLACGGAKAEPVSNVAPPDSAAKPAATATDAPATTAATTTAATTRKAPAGVGQSCGTRGTSPCPAPLFCNYTPADDCGATDMAGHCAAKPEACTANVDPVCGCDGKSYSNDCAAAMAGTGVKKKGACPK